MNNETNLLLLNENELKIKNKAYEECIHSVNKTLNVCTK